MNFKTFNDYFLPVCFEGNKNSEAVYTCDFEADLESCEIEQDQTNHLSWTRRKAGTPTLDTGPSSDHTTGNGRFILSLMV